MSFTILTRGRSGGGRERGPKNCSLGHDNCGGGSGPLKKRSYRDGKVFGHNSE